MPLTPTRVDSRDWVYGTFVTNHDITGVPVEVALPLAGQPPTTSDWRSAVVLSVEPIPLTTNFQVIFRVLVGPGGQVQLDAKQYDWTVRITDGAERPVRRAGGLDVQLV